MVRRAPLADGGNLGYLLQVVLERQLAGLREAGDRLDRLLGDSVEPNAVELQLDPARVEPRDEQEVADEALQPLGAAVDDREEALLLGRQRTGLGLVISQAIAEAHGGTIRVRSTSGVGTCFRFELPIEREESV